MNKPSQILLTGLLGAMSASASAHSPTPYQWEIYPSEAAYIATNASSDLIHACSALTALRQKGDRSKFDPHSGLLNDLRSQAEVYRMVFRLLDDSQANVLVEEVKLDGPLGRAKKERLHNEEDLVDLMIRGLENPAALSSAENRRLIDNGFVGVVDDLMLVDSLFGAECDSLMHGAVAHGIQTRKAKNGHH